MVHAHADTGVMSGATLYIKQDLHVSDVQIEILVGTINIYSLVGSAIAGKTSDMVGRRYTIVIAAVVFFVGAFLMGFATNYAFLMFGRFVAGIGVGYALMIAPVYTAEVAPSSSRGFLTSFPEVFINFGTWSFSIDSSTIIILLLLIIKLLLVPKKLFVWLVPYKYIYLYTYIFVFL